MSGPSRDYQHIGDNVTVQNLLVTGTLSAPASGGGVVVGLTPPFVYLASGLEAPAGFSVAFPSGARGGAPYVALVQYESGAVDFMECAAPPASYADDRIVVKTSGQLQAGDRIAVIIADQ